MSPFALYAPVAPAVWLLAQTDSGVTWPQVAMALIASIPPLIASILAYKAATRAAEGARAAAVTAGVAVTVGKENQSQLVEVKAAVSDNTDKTIKVSADLEQTQLKINGLKDQLVEAVRGRGLAEGREQGAAIEQERVAAQQAVPVAPPGETEAVVTAATAAAKAATTAAAEELKRIATATVATAENTGGLLDNAKGKPTEDKR